MFQALWAKVCFRYLFLSNFFNWLAWFSTASLQAGKFKGPTWEGRVDNSIQQECPLWFIWSQKYLQIPYHWCMLFLPLLSEPAHHCSCWQPCLIRKSTSSYNSGTASTRMLQKQLELLSLAGFLDKPQPFHLPYSPARQSNILFYRTLCFRYSAAKGAVEVIKYMVKGLTNMILRLL